MRGRRRKLDMDALLAVTTREAILEDIRAEVDACNSLLSDADTTTVDEDHVHR